MRIGEAVAAIMLLSKKYPTEQLYLEIQNGQIKFGIPRGPIGDELEAEWQKHLPSFQVWHS